MQTAGCVAQWLERRSLAGELSLSCARPAVMPGKPANRANSAFKAELARLGWLTVPYPFEVDK